MTQDALYDRLKAALPSDRSIVLVGLMGAGKSSIGRRLAKKLGLPFSDADAEIEAAAGQSIADIFAAHGEEEFRAGERKVIARLLAERHGVLATGGGAFMSEETRDRIAERGISVWLKADLDLLHKRTAHRTHRPLLRTADPRKVLSDLIDARYPVYALADVTVESRDAPHEEGVASVASALLRHLEQKRGSA
ncbi:shikimate kinase [Futiania mangrovi]|uniref:Shikimate kinase n=1 Tax=Futiania mangrovi TaxID=2959716 RepID=A0A9J6P8R3_9PROT|nr:shikimate kinase [Futiania mangrovii]MCP1336156.1 shikimate kinase [Futiania mangrovii]